MDVETLKQLEETLRKEVPGLKVAFKSESWVQKVVGTLSAPFNPRYLTNVKTTYGKTIYFPTRDSYYKDPTAHILLAHEFVHVWDAERDKLFRLKYVFPQILAVIPLIAYAILAGKFAWILLVPLVGYVIGAALCRKALTLFVLFFGVSVLAMLGLGWHYTGWKLLCLLGLVVLAPWPSAWRRDIELRGYSMNVAMLQWLDGKVSSERMNAIAGHFVGPVYFFMSWNRSSILRTLEATRQQAQVGALQRISPYGVVFDFLYSRRLLHRM
jgi:hypothetical protein